MSKKKILFIHHKHFGGATSLYDLINAAKKNLMYIY